MDQGPARGVAVIADVGYEAGRTAKRLDRSNIAHGARRSGREIAPDLLGLYEKMQSLHIAELDFILRELSEREAMRVLDFPRMQSRCPSVPRQAEHLFHIVLCGKTTGRMRKWAKR